MAEYCNQWGRRNLERNWQLMSKFRLKVSKWGPNITQSSLDTLVKQLSVDKDSVADCVSGKMTLDFFSQANIVILVFRTTRCGVLL